MNSSLTIEDRLYGKATITSPVLLELIESKPMQRLKKITQYGIPTEYYFTHNFTRYEHSLGTMHLLKNLGASEEEQIAGLLHDASHTAFSHVIDWVVGRTEKEDFQDSMHKNMITGSEISKILTKYKYNPQRIAHYESFPLLEQPVPNLCADRADYGMREFPTNIIKLCVETLTSFNNKIVFKDKTVAKMFAMEYLKVQENLWSYNESAIRYMFFAKMLKIAMKKKIIKFADFWTDDASIMKKVHKSQDKEIMEVLNLMKTTKLLSQLPMSKKKVPKKFRYIDPEILTENKLVRLTSFDANYVEEIKRAKKDNAQGVSIPLFLTKNYLIT